jgi:hypothetical protein
MRALLLAGLLSLVLPAPARAANLYVEEFDTATFQDAASTTADWNTAAGKLRLFPFQPSLVGSYDTAGDAFGVAVLGRTAYVADGAAGLRIVDITDPANPTLLGTYNTPGTALGVALSGTTAYVADDGAGLQIIDVANAAAPVLRGTYNTPGQAYGVAVWGTVAYVADAGAGLQLIDVAIAAAPVLRGTYNTPGTAQSVAISGTRAYVADGATGLVIVDVGDPGAPALLGSYNTAGYASGIAVSGTVAYVADQGPGVVILDVEPPASPALLGSYNSPGGCYGVAVSGPVVYVADGLSGIQVVDASNPASPSPLGTVDTPGGGSAVAVSGTEAYVADTGAGLQVVQVGVRSGPLVLGEYDTPGNARSVAVSGHIAYVADGSGLQILDVSNPASPAFLGLYDPPGIALSVAVRGNIAYLVDGSALRIVDASNPASPMVLASVSPLAFTDDIVVVGTTAYVGGGGFAILDVTNPAAPAVLGVLETPQVLDVAISGTAAYLAVGGAGLLTVDVSDPTAPTPLGWYKPADTVRCVAASGSVVCVGTYGISGGLHLLSTAPNPEFLASYGPWYPISGLVLADKTVYLGTSGGVEAVSVANPLAPVRSGFLATPSFAMDVVVERGMLYVAAASSGLKIASASPLAPTRFPPVALPDLPRDIAVSGTIGYLALGSEGLQTVDLSNPALPALLGSYPTGDALDVEVVGDRAYVAAGLFGLRILDVSDPANPIHLGLEDTPGFAYDVAVSGSVAYVADQTSLILLDVSNPADPSLIGSSGVDAYGVAVAGSYAYVAYWNSVSQFGGLSVLDVSRPGSPTIVGGADLSNVPGEDVVVTGTTAYLVTQAYILAPGGLLIYNVGDPAIPVLVGSHSSPFFAHDVAISGTMAYVAGTEGQILDLADPASPVLAGALATPADDVTSIAISGPMAFVTDASGRLHPFEILEQRFDPRRPTARSLSVDASDDPIRAARLVATSANASVAWELSANGGSTWHPAISGNWVAMEAGADLLWRTSLAPTPPSLLAGAPEVSRLEIEWLLESPVIESIDDVPADQGGRVRVRFARSGYDTPGSRPPAAGYQLYHRVDPALAGQVLAEGQAIDASATGFPQLAAAAPAARMLEGRTFVVGGESAPSFPAGVWEVVAWVAATGSDSYLALAPTAEDSTDTGIAWSVYLATVHATDPAVWFMSRADSGYSIDNLAPNVPTGFVAGPVGGGANQLGWDDPVDADFRYFKLYRGATPDFTPDPGTLVHNTTTTSWTDTDPGGPAYYKLTAVDFAGNESAPALANVTVGVEEASLPASFALRVAGPNPFRDVTRLEFDVPAPGSRVQLDLYDVRGRLVRTLVDGAAVPGTRRIVWDGRDGDGHRLPAGLYLCRMRAPGTMRTEKLMLAR